MRTFADFKRAAVAGSVWTVVNNLHPAMSGRRTVTKLQGNGLFCDAIKADGTEVKRGWLPFPKAAAVRVEGNSVHFLMEPGSDKVAFTWTLMQD